MRQLILNIVFLISMFFTDYGEMSVIPHSRTIQYSYSIGKTSLQAHQQCGEKIKEQKYAAKDGIRLKNSLVSEPEDFDYHPVSEVKVFTQNSAETISRLF